MREIKFRGKRLDNGEWVHGYLIKLGKYDSSDNDRFGITDKAIPAGFCGVVYNLEIIEVDPTTVGQFTGLNDCNGREIFEGDILQAWDYPRDRLTFVVKWYVNTASFNLMGLNTPAFVDIGNCYENTGLLEGGQVNE